MNKTWLFGMLSAFFATGVCAQSDWPAIEKAAQGETVHFNAWGGGEAINAYIDWAADTVKQR